MKDKFTLSGVWDDSDAAINGSFNLAQNVNRKSFSAVNDLKLVRRTEKKLFTIMSRNSFVHRPDRLLVSGHEDAVQAIGTTDFRTTTETQLGKLTRFWKYYLTAGVDMDYHRINTSLAGLDMVDNIGVHEAFLSNVYTTPQVDYERNNWRMSLRVPVKWLHYSIAGQHDYINVCPRIYLRRRISAKSELSASAV